MLSALKKSDGVLDDHPWQPALQWTGQPAQRETPSMPAIDEAQMQQIAETTWRQDIRALEGLIGADPSPFLQVAGSLLACSGMVWVTAVGTSATVAARFAHILTCSGARAMFLSPADGLHGHAAALEPQDVLFALSRGGESDDVNAMVEIARQRHVRSVALVHDLNSTLARLADWVQPVQSPQSYELKGVLATTSTLAFSAMCDALCAVVAESRGFSRSDFQRLHPHGAVGKALKGSD
jgi:D-arabinose 5-phosphate isomerase GutQ